MVVFDSLKTVQNSMAICEQSELVEQAVACGDKNGLFAGWNICYHILTFIYANIMNGIEYRKPKVRIGLLVKGETGYER